MPFDTLEAAQAEIVRLTDELAVRTTERDTLSQDNENLTNDLNQARTLNQQLFNRVIAQNSDPDGKTDDKDEEPLSCEEFAKTLKI